MAAYAARPGIVLVHGLGQGMRSMGQGFGQKFNLVDIVTLDGALLGKPAGPSDAVEMLVRLRNRPHKVYSGVTVAGVSALFDFDAGARSGLFAGSQTNTPALSAALEQLAPEISSMSAIRGWPASSKMVDWPASRLSKRMTK